MKEQYALLLVAQQYALASYIPIDKFVLTRSEVEGREYFTVIADPREFTSIVSSVGRVTLTKAEFGDRFFAEELAEAFKYRYKYSSEYLIHNLINPGLELN